MENSSKLLALERQVEVCKRCDLFKSATHAVPGSGNRDSKVVFVGEAPGYHEDLKGKPFVGNAGKLLDLLLDKIGLRREDIFITNVLKHRPPENRDPTPAEVAACTFWLEQQLELIAPKLVVTLGRWSLNYFLPAKKISEIHGKAFKINNLIILPMYHPAAALRNGNIGRELENDFLKNKNLLTNPGGGLKDNDLFEEGQGSLF